MNINTTESKFSRFQLFMGDVQADTSLQKTKNVGMAYLSEGHDIYSLRLWMFSSDRYYIVSSKSDPAKFIVMTREPNKSPEAKNKFYWNIVGNGMVDSKNGVMRLEFDLLSQPVYMNLRPEASAFNKNIPEPDIFKNAA